MPDIAAQLSRPTSPGAIAVFASLAAAVASIVGGHNNPLRAALVNSLFALCLILVWRLNAYEALCLERRIDELAKVAAD